MKKNNSEVNQKQQLKKATMKKFKFLIKLTNQRRTISINEYYDGMFEPISIVLYYYKLFVTDNYNTVGNIFKRPPYMIKQHI